MDIAYHGNYCGPGWSAGRYQSSVVSLVPAVDAFDQTCKEHDAVYATGGNRTMADAKFFYSNVTSGNPKAVIAGLAVGAQGFLRTAASAVLGSLLYEIPFLGEAYAVYNLYRVVAPFVGPVQCLVKANVDAMPEVTVDGMPGGVVRQGNKVMLRRSSGGQPSDIDKPINIAPSSFSLPKLDDKFKITTKTKVARRRKKRSRNAAGGYEAYGPNTLYSRPS